MPEWIISSCILAAAVIAIRYICLGRLSPAVQYALWGLVLVRLLIPFSIGESSISIANALYSDSNYSESENPPPRDYDDVEAPQAEALPAEVSDTTPDRTPLLMSLWLMGAAAAALWFAVINITMYVKLLRSRTLLEYVRVEEGLPVYLAEDITSPCVFGIFRPAIYVTKAVAEDEKAFSYALSHELAHYRHLDHIWALLRCAALVLHWYNPLVWWAAVLSRRDAELFADDTVLKRLGDDSRVDYGRTLLGIASKNARPYDMLRCATTMSAGGKGMKERIVMIAEGRKRAVLLTAVIILVAVFAAGCAFTGAEHEKIDMDRGVFVTVNAGDVYGIDWYGENSGGGVVNADGSSIVPGERLKMDIDGLDAGMQRFTLSAIDKNEHMIARGQFNIMFTDDTRCEIELTEDLKFVLKEVEPPAPRQGEAEAAEETRDDRAAAKDMVARLVAGESVDSSELLSCAASLENSDWGEFEGKYSDTEWWGPLMRALDSASIGDDQRLRDEYMIRVFLSSDGAYSEGIGVLLAKQEDTDPDAFSAALSGFDSAQQRSILNALSITRE